MANSTWSGLTVKQDEIWDKLFDEYVPDSGQASTIGGEILRAMSRIIYRFYNDGGMVGVGYGNETVNSSDRYLSNMVPEYLSLNDVKHEEKSYEKAMRSNHRTVFAYLQANPALFESLNEVDSRQASEEDYERSREYEGYGEYGDSWDEEYNEMED